MPHPSIYAWQDSPSQRFESMDTLGKRLCCLLIPLVAHPAVPQEKVAAVRAAFLHMADDPAGLQVLTESAALIKLDPPYGFVAATDSEYDNARAFFKHTVLPSN